MHLSMRSKVISKLMGLAAASIVLTAGPALAQSAGTGGNGGSTTHAGGSTVSGGSSSSSASISTSGGGSAGVVQGNVAGGSQTSGTNSAGGGENNQSGSSTSGDSVGGQVAGADAPVAVKDGVLKKLDLPAIGTTTDAIPASRTGADMLTYALVALIVTGLAVLYRRLPRPSRA